MIISAIRNFFALCPALDGKKVNADFLSENAPNFAVYSEKADPVLKKYADGSELLQFVFSFRMRAPYSAKATENEKIGALFQSVKAWICEQEKNENYPDIESEGKVVGIEVLSQGHLKNTNAADCVYQMNCRIIYYKRRHI